MVMMLISRRLQIENRLDLELNKLISKSLEFVPGWCKRFESLQLSF